MSAELLSDWVSRRVVPAVEVFAGSAADAAWQLVLVELEEDLDLGRDPLASLRMADGPSGPEGS